VAEVGRVSAAELGRMAPPPPPLPPPLPDDAATAVVPGVRGLHSSTFQLNLSRFRHKTPPQHPLRPLLPPDIALRPPK
jgi:hypothetical protein